MDDQEALRRQGAAVDRTVGAVGGLIMGVLGTAAYGPAGAAIAPAVTAATAPWIEEISFYARTAVSKRARRAIDAVEVAAETAGMTSVELLERTLKDEVLTELAGRVIEAAAASTFQHKVTALGQALGRAAVDPDHATVDIELLFVDAFSQIDAVHIRLLTLLESEAPHSYIPAVLGADSEEHRRYRRAWTPDFLESVDSGLSGVSRVLISRLNALGLTESPTGQTLPRFPVLLTEFGVLCLARLRDDPTG